MSPLIRALLVSSLLSAPYAIVAGRPPNFIFILSDDIAQGDRGCYGQELIQTPHLDQMAAEGTRQLDIEIYLNGSLIGKINSTENSAHIEKEFKTSALKYLKTGENVLAIKTRHNWRWGQRGMVVYNVGFDFNLDARIKA